MFSEYASRFLEQSQLRSGVLRQAQRRFANLAHPSASPAPLFQSSSDLYHNESDHEQEISDYYALMSSRRFVNQYEGLSNYSEDSVSKDRMLSYKHSQIRVGDIQSSWGSDGVNEGTSAMQDTVVTSNPLEAKSEFLQPGSLERKFGQNSVDLNPPALWFTGNMPNLPQNDTRDEDTASRTPRLGTNIRIPPRLGFHPEAPLSFDAVWAKLYSLTSASIMTTFLLIWMRNPSPTLPFLGDSIYNALQQGWVYLLIDIIIAGLISVTWILTFRYFARLITTILLFSMPFTMLVVSVYQLVASYNGKWHGSSLQDKAMRYFSVVLISCIMVWALITYRKRECLRKSLQIMELSCQILVENKWLYFMACSVAGFTIILSWSWLVMFSHVFLGHTTGIISVQPVTDKTTLVLTFVYIFIYAWTLAIISGLQRSITAMIVCHWFFYRHALPSVSEEYLLAEALHRAITTIFGTICFQSFVKVLTELPILLLPRQISKPLVFIGTNVFLSTSQIRLTSPLVLTYCAIHPAKLSESIHSVQALDLFNDISTQASSQSSRPSYELTKSLLFSMRLILSLLFGTFSWLASAHGGVTGSLYGYVVGLVAVVITWGVLGATINALTGIIDGVLICLAVDDPDDSHCHLARQAYL